MKNIFLSKKKLKTLNINDKRKRKTHFVANKKIKTSKEKEICILNSLVKYNCGFFGFIF